MDKYVLTSFGFSKNESILYMTLLELGESKVSSLVKAAHFRSGKVYEILDSLVQKGVISYVVKNNVTYYYAHEPKKVLDYILEQRKSLEKKSTEFAQMLSSFTRSKKEICSTKVFEGVQGVRNALSLFVHSLSKNSVIDLYGANDDVKRDIILQWPDFRDIAEQKKIATHIIMSSLTKSGRKKRMGNSSKYKYYRYLPGSDISNFMVSGDFVLLFNFSVPNCIFIENKDHANQFKELFSVLWKVAKKL